MVKHITLLKRVEKKLSLLAEKLSLEKKVCGFEWCLVRVKNILSLLAGKIQHCATDFSPQ